MASTQALLNLTNSFPEAFADPEAAPSQTGSAASRLETNPRLQGLLTLMDEYPEAFADPEAPMTTLTATPEPVAMPDPAIAEAPAVPASELSLPAAYELSLNRTVSTFTWGQIEAHLSYSASGLVSLWLVVGKSGTEIQSLCEAVCRLTNLLLAHQVPTAEVVRQLRGIRGADSEGLGPHRILGLADLIGKVLQEAPASLSNAVVAPAAKVQTVVETEQVLPSYVAPSHSVEPQPIMNSVSLSPSLLELSDNNHRMSVCPECGSELQAMNGCSGGACQVCGFSSCS